MRHHLFHFLRVLVLFHTSTLFCQSSSAQYYYHDIALTYQNLQQQQLLKKNRVMKVKILSFEANGQLNEDFFCEITPNSNYTQINTITKTDFAGNSSQTIFYNANGQPFRSLDSSDKSVNKYEYNYDTNGRLISALNISEGSNNTIQQKEVHEWQYDSKSCPEIMYRVKNATDTTIVKFICDNDGNIIEEESWSRHISKEKIYYYYDSLNRLTDIVRYQPRLSRLLPDYMFEYDNKSQIIQMIAIQQGGNDYLIWQYEYLENGLKSIERCLNKQKKLVGKIVYQYTIENK